MENNNGHVSWKSLIGLLGIFVTIMIAALSAGFGVTWSLINGLDNRVDTLEKKIYNNSFYITDKEDDD